MSVQKLTGLLTGWQWEQGVSTADSDMAGVSGKVLVLLRYKLYGEERRAAQ